MGTFPCSMWASGELEDEPQTFEDCLADFIEFQSVSVSDSDFHKEGEDKTSSPFYLLCNAIFTTLHHVYDHSSECWRCAKYLTSILERMGASVKMVSLVEDRSPVVLARFGSDPLKPTVTFYGHYDVVPATEIAWKSDPFAMVSVNGFLYGRGVTDNKGPIMAMIFALKELMELGRLDFNAVLLIEGEEEAKSEGFREAVMQNLHWFRGTSLVLHANSTWIGEDR